MIEKQVILDYIELAKDVVKLIDRIGSPDNFHVENIEYNFGDIQFRMMLVEFMFGDSIRVRLKEEHILSETFGEDLKNQLIEDREKFELAISENERKIIEDARSSKKTEILILEDRIKELKKQLNLE